MDHMEGLMFTIRFGRNSCFNLQKDPNQPWDRSRLARVIKYPLLWVLVTLLIGACTSGYGYPYELLPLGYSLEEIVEPFRWGFILVGLSLLLLGWKLYRFAIALPGIVLGAGLGMMLGGMDFNFWSFVGLLLGALFGGWIALVLHDLVIFLIGGAVAALATGGLWIVIFNLEPPALLLIIMGIIGGVLLLALSRAALVFLSAAVGALSLGIGMGTEGPLILVFFIVGVVVQYGLATVMGEQEQAFPAQREVKARLTNLRSGEKADRSDKGQIREPEPPARGQATGFLLDPHGRRILLRDRDTLGRGTTCQIRVSERQVSRQHALFRKAEGAWYVQDQDSASGTFVNDQNVRATQLRDGDRIRVGQTTFIFKE